MVDTRGPPYKFDFLETIVGVNFAPPGGYMVIEAEAMAQNAGTSPPPCPPINIHLGPKEVLVDRSEQCTPHIFPGSDTVNSIYYVWNPMAALPTKETMSVIISNVDTPISYITQFAKIVNMGSGYLYVGAYGTQLAGYSGIFPSLSAAQAYADLWNARFGHGVGGFDYPEMAFNVTGTFANPAFSQVGPAHPNVVASRLDISIVTPPSSTMTKNGRYLIKVPRKSTDARVTAPGLGDVSVKGYHGATPPKLVNVNPGGYDDISFAVGGAEGVLITSEVTKTGPEGRDFTNVVAHGGGSGYGGGG